MNEKNNNKHISKLLPIVICVTLSLLVIANKVIGDSATDSIHSSVPAIQKSLEIPTSPKKMQEQIISRLAYTLSYNKSLRLPNWVAWHLSSAHTKGKFKRTELKFEEDTTVSKPRATNWDYVQSGYDRGHMCPSGDNRWSEQAQRESFIYTNCCPQRHSLNSEEWEELESRCRHWANVYGDIYIVCGPMFSSKDHKTIGKNRIAVPDAFFKVVLRMGKSPAAIGFTYKNEGNTGTMSNHVCTVDYIEKLTGIDFFPTLSDNLENKLEAEANLADWK